MAAPFFGGLKKNTSAKLEIKATEESDEKAWEEKLNDFFKFIDNRTVRVSKIEQLSREELNER